MDSESLARLRYAGRRRYPVRMNYPSVCRTLEISGFGELPQDIASIDNASKVKLSQTLRAGKTITPNPSL
eukprot:4687361-Prymnesium_polylepis.1